MVQGPVSLLAAEAVASNALPIGEVFQSALRTWRGGIAAWLESLIKNLAIEYLSIDPFLWVLCEGFSVFALSGHHGWVSYLPSDRSRRANEMGVAGRSGLTRRARIDRPSREKVTSSVNDSSVGDLARSATAGGFSFPFGASRAVRPVQGEGCTACQIKIRLNHRAIA